MIEGEKVDNSGKYLRANRILTAGFFSLFFAFNTVQAFQSQVNKNVGYIALGLLYGSFCFFCIFSPKIVNILGSKWSMVLGGSAYVAMMFCNIKMIPGLYYAVNFLTGIGAAVLWTAQGAYLARCADYYRDIKRISKS